MFNHFLSFDTRYVIHVHHNSAPIPIPPIPHKVIQMECFGNTKPNRAKVRYKVER